MNKDEKEYLELIDNIYKKIKTKTKEESDRFEIPKAEVLNQGTITLFRNFQIVADKLRREPKILASFLSKELAAPVEITGDKLKIKAKIRREFVNKKIELFVKKYVLCSQCHKPDTKLVIDGREKYLICEACGARTAVR